MAQWHDLLASISATTADYREGDLAAPTPEHVTRWVNQFDTAVRLPILVELDHVLKKTYFSRKGTKEFLRGLFQSEKLAGKDPCVFWRHVQFLDIQLGGASQKEMLALFNKVLEKECGFEAAACGADSRDFVYLDDAIFTGNRVRRDLEGWIANEAPATAKVHIVAIALHLGGYYYANSKLKEAANKAGKNVEFTWWRAIALEDRKAYTNSSDVLRPVSIPNDALVQAYVASMRYPPYLRIPGQIGGNGIFSGEAGRHLLEQELLKAGARIRERCPYLGDTQRPLGHMTLETLGFGSLIVTFRNCPNNAPLALWAGDPWYPLFARTTNSATSMKHFMAMLKKDVF